MSAGTDAPPFFVKRLLAVGAGEFVSKAAVAVAFMWLARVLEPSVYGQIEWALAILTVAAMIADGGLGTWAASELGARPAAAPRLVAEVGVLRLALASITCLVLLAIALAEGGTAGTTLAVYSLVLLVSPFLLQYVFNGLFRSEWAGLVSAVRGLGFMTAVLLLGRVGAPAWRIGVAEIAAAVAAGACSVVVVRAVLRLRIPVWSGSQGALSLLGRSWTIGASEVTWAVHWYAGLIVLGYLASPRDAAWHSAGLRLVLALHTAVWLYLFVLLPGLAKTVAVNAPGWRRTIEQSLRWSGWIGCGVALVGTLGARPIVDAVFGPAFRDAVPGLRVMIWVLPVALASGHYRYSLIALGQPRRDLQAALAGAGTTIALTLALVPALLSLGAALALLGGTVANAVAAGVLSQGTLPPVGFVGNVWRSGAACLGCLALGAILTPAAGAVPSTLAAGALLAGVALVAERANRRRHHTHADL